MVELLPGFGVLFNHLRELYQEWHELSAALRWAATGLIFVFIEFNTRRLLAVWLAPACFLTALIAIPLADSLAIQELFFFSLVGLTFYYRPLIMKKYVGEDDNFPPVEQRLIGRTATCTRPITGFLGPGAVNIGGHLWRAIEPGGRFIDINQPVRVIGRDDTTLLVTPVRQTQPDHWLPEKLIGRRGQWIGSQDPMVNLRGDYRQATPWPPDHHLKTGQPVLVIGINEDRLIVKSLGPGNSNCLNPVGSIGICTETIDGEHLPGAALVDGVTWRARTEKETIIAAGGFVRIALVDGATIVVQPVETPANRLT